MSEQTPDDAPAGKDAVQAPGNNAAQAPDKPVQDWATGDEPATGPQLSYLSTLAREAGEDVPGQLTKGQASELIDRLQQRSPRVD